MDWSLSKLLAVSLSTAAGIMLLLWWYVYRSRRVLLDHQQQRSLHQGQAVTGGGIFIFVPLSLIGVWWFPAVWPLYLILLLCLLGWADDQFDLSFQLRLLVQLLAAVFTLHYFGLAITGPLAALLFVFLLLSLLWWVNLFNFMDGANGMAGLHAMVSLGGYLWLLDVSSEMAFLALVTLLAVAVYLVFNLLLNRLFMGDSGSLPLAWTIAVLALYGVTTGQLTLIQVALVHAVFITDATLTLFNRMRRKEAITQAHASHLYQRLIKNGAGHAQVSMVYALLTAVCVLLVWLVHGLPVLQQAAACAIIYLILLLIFMKNLNTGR